MRVHLIESLFVCLTERFSNPSATLLDAQYHIIPVGPRRFRHIFFPVYLLRRPISVLFPSRYRCTIDFNVSFSGRLPTQAARFIYLFAHERIAITATSSY